MRFALIDSEKVEAKSGLKGICPGCSQEMIAKCGIQRIHHWAHKGNKVCDSWWEPETEWHRSWKNNYPTEWQEVFLPDSKTGEKHIADVRTIHGLVIEFQHSNIQPLERRAREDFYNIMVWVVDGTRLKRDYPRFLKGKNNTFENTIFYETNNPKIFRVDLVDWCFPVAWLGDSVPVVFDFLGDGTLEDEENIRNNLYCLFPQIGKYAMVAEISRKAFIKSTINGEWTIKAQKFIEELKIQADNERTEQLQATLRTSNRVISSSSRLQFLKGYKFRRRRRF